MLMGSKKGQADMSTTMSYIIGALIVVILATALAPAMFSNIADSEPGKSATNETGYINSTGYSVELTDTCTQSYSITSAYDISNESDHVLIPSANYTITGSGLVYNGTNAEYSDAYISYTCETSTPSWVPVVLFVIVGAGVIFFIYRTFLKE